MLLLFHPFSIKIVYETKKNGLQISTDCKQEPLQDTKILGGEALAMLMAQGRNLSALTD